MHRFHCRLTELDGVRSSEDYRSACRVLDETPVKMG